MTDRIGDDYQKRTKYHRSRMPGGTELTTPAPPFKTYKNVLRMELPEPQTEGGPGLWNIVAARRSERDFDVTRSIGMEKLSTLLWAVQGITARIGRFPLRACPSAGALYPVETYLAVGKIEGLKPGAYHLDILNWDLEQLHQGDIRPQLARAALGQAIVAEAAATAVFSSIVARSKWKYGERGYRYMYLDAGHIGQNLALAAKALDMGSCAIGAFFDDEVNAVFGLDGEHETAIYMTCFGPVMR